MLKDKFLGHFASRGFTWFLLATLLNPAMMVPYSMYSAPAMARDTDIYLAAAFGSNGTAEPAILLVLDTSDSMNIPEPWAERDAGFGSDSYDSHVEYLWNDLVVLCANGTAATSVSTCTEQITEPALNGTNPLPIATSAIPQYPSSTYGTWAGKTDTQRQALWTAAKTSAFATYTGDSGPAYTWRNYNDLSWIYWLPSTVTESDQRLTSPSWNRFRGYIQQKGGTRGGLAFSGVNDYTAYNLCNASLPDLTPSTVFVPSNVVQNSGVSLNQQLARWDPYKTLTTVGNSGYPGGSNQQTSGYAKGYLDETNTPTGSPSDNPVYRDNNGTSPVGSLGLPIRYDSGTSTGAGWDDVKADMGGYNFLNEVVKYSTTGGKTMLDIVLGWYSLTASDIDNSLTTNLADSQFIAIKGNRDVGTTAFGSVTGLSAYIDTTAATCDASAGPSSTTCIAKTSGATGNITVTATATCNNTNTGASTGTNETDAAGAVRNRGEICALSTPSCGATDTNGAAFPNCSDASSQLTCTTNTANSSITTQANSGCALNSAVTTTINPCVINNSSVTIGACGYSGQTTIPVAACALSGQSTQTVATCAFSGRSTYNVGTCTWSGRQTGYLEGSGWYAYGGSCLQNGSTSFCSASGSTINGGTNASGFYATSSAAAAASAGCANTVSSGTTYQYGGTCTENGSPLSCAVSGGSTVTINGTSYNNVNGSCANNNSPAAGTYKVGGSCMENGSTASCSTTTGTSVTIRGTSYTGVNRTCGQLVAAGTYKTGGTCAGSNNSCTAGATTPITIRGTLYNQTSTCTGTAAGTYAYGGTACTSPGSGTANTCTYNPGTTLVVGGTTYLHVNASCSAAVVAGTYNTGGTCLGTTKVLAAFPSSVVLTTNSTAAACNTSTTTVTGVGTVITGCSNKANTTTNCSTRYSANCTTTCNPAGNTSKSSTGGATSGTTNYFRVFNKQNAIDYLYHDCKADEAGGTFMRGITPLRTTGTLWSTTTSDTSTVAPYTNVSSSQIPADSAKNVNMYSVNYLNWKYGPKGPHGRPIGRKTRLQIAKDALTELVKHTDGVRFGLMVFNKISTAHTSEGGNVAYAMHRMGGSTADADYVNRAALISKINGLVATSQTPLTETLYEAYLYFNGQTPLFGTSTAAALDGSGTVSKDYDTSAISGGKYVSPMLSNPTVNNAAPCQRNYIVYVTDGGPEDDSSVDSYLNTTSTLLTQGPPFLTTTVSVYQSDTASHQFEATTGVPYGSPDAASPNRYILFDELSYFMANADISPNGGTLSDSIPSVQTVGTYTIGFAGANAPVLEHAAHVWNGQYYTADNSADLAEALLAAIASIRNWNPSLAAATVPVSSYNHTQSSDEEYLSFFGPKLNQSWPGTLKKYLLSTRTEECGKDWDDKQVSICLTGQTTLRGSNDIKNVQLYDTDVSGQRTDDIDPAAVSYWSDVNEPDSSYANKGGSGYVLKSSALATLNPSTRKVYTVTDGAYTGTAVDLTASTNAFSEANSAITKTLLGDASMSDETRATLINYLRGGDTQDTSCNDASTSTDCTTWSAWPHHDILHSQPTILNYSAGVSTMFYMTNDGLLHAIDPSDGHELWTFLVTEAMPKLSGMFTNAVGEHIIGADGTPVLYTETGTVSGVKTLTKAYLTFGLRRGGRAYYAMDVLNRTTPKLLWKINNGATGFSELGESWSIPDVQLFRGVADPVAVFGAGYDPRPNDMINAYITRVGTVATVALTTEHGYAVGDTVTISGTAQTEYNGDKTVTAVTPTTFTFTVAGTPVTPATASVDATTHIENQIKVVGKQATNQGRGVFFVNARTGALIKSFTGGTAGITGMSYSMPSDAVMLNTDQNIAGYVDRLYMGDLGGNVWRFDVSDSDPANWQAIKFADLTGSDTPTRKIFFPPAALAVADSATFLNHRFDAVYVGTGDLENPLRFDNVDKMFMIKDQFPNLVSGQTSAVVYNASTFYNITDNSLQTGDATEQADALTQLQGAPGWVFDLTAGSKPGEKAVNRPAVLNNVLGFGTYSPLTSSSACAQPGQGNIYEFNALDGRITIDPAKHQVSSDGRRIVDANLRGFPSPRGTAYVPASGFGGAVPTCAPGSSGCNTCTVGTAGCTTTYDGTTYRCVPGTPGCDQQCTASGGCTCLPGSTNCGSGCGVLTGMHIPSFGAGGDTIGCYGTAKRIFWYQELEK